jgi:hypothetical protein
MRSNEQRRSGRAATNNRHRVTEARNVAQPRAPNLARNLELLSLCARVLIPGIVTAERTRSENENKIELALAKRQLPAGPLTAIGGIRVGAHCLLSSCRRQN